MWNPTLAAIVQVPIYGDPESVDTDIGPIEIRPVVGHEPGVHVNLPADLVTPELEAYRVEPATPAFVLVGVETAFLVFPDEETAQSCAEAAGLWIEEPSE